MFLQMLRVGKVAYLNTLPMFYSFGGFKLVEGHPTELVKKLRAGEIDAGIVSSAEYFFNPQDYYILPDISISSKGKVCSVLLLSNKPLEEVEKVRITPNSLTSRYLLTFVLKEVHGIAPKEVTEGEDALLLIGDEALNLRELYRFTYDLGEEWFNATGLPFVFALFLIRKDVPEEGIRALHRELKTSIQTFFADLKKDRVQLPGNKDFLKHYFSNCIDYELGAEHLKSLRRFFTFLERETGKSAPEFISLFPLL
ncbi:chorismate dehydratase [Hydrogenivirga caldilitoris]|uniref:Chorismate dehydratase n=1 Tax=Hydrogenivirga caldilitoris TaxID=246264 RepID=A0A497XPJ2_9AQUI|nr:menaquinone biosynthesis protein [Hydrogenivirga caldilitoris]RLJ70808.1 chorismate dehydratase [Hydrogenivirga caldilitoris]